MTITVGREKTSMFPRSRFFPIYIISLGLVFSVANAQFVVQPMVISRTMAPGSSDKLTLSLENRGPDHIQVRAETVDLAKDKEGHWILLNRDAQDTTDLVIAESCRQWLVLETAETGVIDIEPKGTTSLDLEICVPAAAQGAYQAAVRIMLASTTESGVRVRYAFVVPVLLEIRCPEKEKLGPALRTGQTHKLSSAARDCLKDVRIEAMRKQLSFTSGRCNAEPNAISLLEKYAQNQDKLESSFAVTLETTRNLTRNDGLPNEPNRILTHRLCHDGKRGLSTYSDSYDDNTKSYSLYDDNRCIGYKHLPPDHVDATRAFISRNREFSDRMTDYTGYPFLGFPFTDEKGRIDKAMLATTVPSVRTDREMIGADSCIVVDGKNDTFSYSLWLNPNKGYTAAKATIYEKLPESAELVSDTKAKQPFRAITVTDIDISMIDGVHVPMACSIRYDVLTGSGVSFWYTDRVKVTDIALNPDHDKLKSFVLPWYDGTPVYDVDFRVEYTIKNGKYVNKEGWVVDDRDAIAKHRGSYSIVSSLIGRPLPSLGGFGLAHDLELLEDKRLLICFWDFRQRPSRHLLEQLVERADSLREQDIVVIVIQTAKLDQVKLDEWIKNRNVPFALGSLVGEEKAVFGQWSVRGLPWLILTDKDHIVTHEALTIPGLNRTLLR